MTGAARRGNGFPAPPSPAGARLVDARLSLLDRQLLDADGSPVGIVDDLDIDGITIGDDVRPGGPAPTVTAILTGKVLATRIFGGQPPRSKLQVLPWALVGAVGTVVRLIGTDLSFDGLWLEHWLRDNIIDRIPGGRHAAE